MLDARGFGSDDLYSARPDAWNLGGNPDAVPNLDTQDAFELL